MDDLKPTSMLSKIFCCFSRAHQASIQPSTSDLSSAHWASVNVPADKINELSRLLRRLNNSGPERELFRTAPGTKILQTRINGKFHKLTLAGSGGQGVVLTALDNKGDRIAVKAIISKRNNSSSLIRLYREMMIGRSVKHRNICSLISVLPPIVPGIGRALLIFKYVPTTLSERVRLGEASSFDRPSHLEITAWIYQILSATLFLHRSGIIHRDLKPSNVGLDTCSDADFVRQFHSFPFNQIKLLDFGMARIVPDRRPLTPNLGTFSYRAPELLLDNNNHGPTETFTVIKTRPPDVFERRQGFRLYDKSIDMWAIGVMLAELLLPKSKFFRSDGVIDEGAMLKVLASTIPIATSDEYANLIGKDNVQVLQKVAERVEQRHTPPERLNDKEIPMSEREGDGDACRDLVSRLLCWDPRARLSADRALQHTYFSQVFQEEDLMVHPQIVQDPIDLFSEEVALRSDEKLVQSASNRVMSIIPWERADPSPSVHKR